MNNLWYAKLNKNPLVAKYSPFAAVRAGMVRLSRFANFGVFYTVLRKRLKTRGLSDFRILL